MDSNDLEKERGITILAKCTSVEWTPEAARDLPHQYRRHPRPRRLRRRGGAHPVDGRRRDPAGRRRRRADAADQVRHRQGARPRPQADRRRQQDRPPRRAARSEVLDEVFDLFVSLDANDEQLDFPVLYASGRDGYASEDIDAREGDLTPLFKLIVSHVPAPDLDRGRRLQLARHAARPRQFPGPHPDRPHRKSGALKVSMPIHALDVDGKVVEAGRATKVLRLQRARARAGAARQGGRHRRHCRADRRDRFQHHLRSRGHRADRTPSRSTRRRWP